MNKIESTFDGWIKIDEGDNDLLINLNSLSNITFTQLNLLESGLLDRGEENIEDNDKYLIILTPNVNVFSDSDKSSAIWNSHFTGQGKYVLSYSKLDEWEKDKSAIIKAIKVSH